ncbi:MAG: M20 family metallopeptidase [Eubacteriales bacterium]|nr:M20 family metallopeptidase [Eubacteriales bacterium]
MLDYKMLIKKYEKDMIRNRRYLHQHPELGFDLDNTVRYVKEELTEMGCEPMDIGNHGITAVIGEKEGKCILLRADMDALPMKEESGLPFACTSDNAAHTCGHDIHTTMLLTAARILKEREDKIPGTVKLLFQPAEEIGYGCRNMVESGILENPKVDAAFGIHVMSCFPKETVLYGTGSLSTGADLFTITVHGKGGHGSVPHTTIDPINIASHIVINLQTVNSREVDAQEMVVLNFGAMNAGSAGNVIPETAILKGNIRTFRNDIREQVKKRVAEIAEQTAEMFGGSAEIEYSLQMATVTTDPEITKLCGDEIKKYIDPAKLNDHILKLPFSEDFSNISELVPSTFFLVGAAPESSEVVMQHNPRVIFDEESMKTGVLVYVAGAMGYLNGMEEKEICM